MNNNINFKISAEWQRDMVAKWNESKSNNEKRLANKWREATQETTISQQGREIMRNQN